MAERIFVIDESTPEHKLILPGQGRGLEMPARGSQSYEGVAEPFPNELLIPRSDWEGIIKEQEERKTRIIDVCDREGLKRKSQASTNFCWINAPTTGVEIRRIMSGHPYVELSPASAGAQIKNFQNVGGWGKEALEWLIKYGACPVSMWPANAIDRRYLTAAAKAEAMKYRGQEWWVLDERNIDQLVSCILRGFSVSIGLNWWRHEVEATFCKWIDNAIAIGIDNSWGLEWGTQGRGVLQGSRALPDDAVSLRTAIAA